MPLNIRDPDFQEILLKFVCRDRNFLKKMAEHDMLSAEDFKPKGEDGTFEAYLIAQKAFEYWDKYREPIGGMLRHEVMDYISNHKRKIGNKTREKLIDLSETIRKAEHLVAVEAIEEKVATYKQHKAMARAIREMINLKESGDLDPVKFYKICEDAVERHGVDLKYVTYGAGRKLKRRIARRIKVKHRTYPYLLIEQLDRSIRTFPRKNFGLILAKYKTGKSTFAAYLDQVYALQGYNVLHFTTEDPKEDVEDKLDASFCGVKLKELSSDKGTKALRRRLRRALRRLRAKIRIVDCTDGGVTIARMEEIWEKFRNQGFDADVVIIDSDEGVEPLTHYKEQGGDTRESKDMYKDFKKFVSRRELWGWITAQTKRGRGDKRQMVITPDDSATDISKARKCAMCIGVGDGLVEWGSNGRYIYIGAHRYDRMKIGWNIKGNFKRGMFYDKEKTEEARELTKHRKRHK